MTDKEARKLPPNSFFTFVSDEACFHSLNGAEWGLREHSKSLDQTYPLFFSPLKKQEN